MRFYGEYGHIFVDSLDEWVSKSLETRERIVAYTHFAGNDYWATDKQVNESDLYVIDVPGIKMFKRQYIGPKAVRVIYIHVGLIELYRRMRARGATFTESISRLVHDIWAFRGVKRMADVVIENKNVWEARDDMVRYIEDVTNR